LGCGAAVHLTEQLRLNMSYFCTLYSDYTKEQTAYQGLPIGGTDTFSRTNHVIGVGIDYRF
jgi:long-chain fatty acid transport protein